MEEPPAERATVGGYTKIATVITADMPLIGQCKAGDRIRFREVTPEDEEAAAPEEEEADVFAASDGGAEQDVGGETGAESAEGEPAAQEPVAEAPAEEPAPAMETPQPAVTVAPRPANESSGGSAALAVGMIVAGVAAVGAGGWYAYRTLGHRRRRRRR